jgi:hypothetical protein
MSMPTPSELVTDAFADAQAYANEAKTQLSTFTSALNSALQLAPTIDVTFNPIAAPSAASVAPYEAPTAYTSSLLADLANALIARIAGGTGISPAVETAIWDRARERELAAAQANIDVISSEAEALGFQLPPGVLVEGIRRETRAYYDKVSTFSRDVAIKQAELEQTNIQKAIEQATQYEASLADLVSKRAQMSLDAFLAEVKRFEAEVAQDIKLWEGEIAQYKAQAEYIQNAQRMNTAIIQGNLATVLEAAKVGAQVYAQLTASAYSLIHASASVSASSSNSVGYSYGNDTTTTVPPVTAV